MDYRREILAHTVHRPWPMPAGPWIMEQGWYDLLFAHWEVPVAKLRPLIPAPLELDRYANSSAWVSITPFRLTMRPRGLPVAGRLWTFPEMNFRTYVRYQDKPGIVFFSLDAGSLLAVTGARIFYRLPYFHAEMQITRRAGAFHYESRRTLGGSDFSASYQPMSNVFHAAPGSLEHWLAERYCLYTVAAGRVFRAEIHHGPWPLQQAEAEIAHNTLPQQVGISLAARPDVLQYSAREEVLIWPLRPA